MLTHALALPSPAVATGDADADDDSRPLEEAALSEVTVKALRSRGITRLFPIQAACLAPALEGRDIVARAKTGSGKTLAFAIPILEKLLKGEGREHGKRPAPLSLTHGQVARGPSQHGMPTLTAWLLALLVPLPSAASHDTPVPSPHAERPPGRQSPGDAPRCLVLCPTRELASQVEREIEQSAPHTRCVTVYGGAATGPQVAALRRGSDLVVGTPGRVMDLVERGALNLRECGFLVLDESDMMLDMGFRDDMDWILQRMPSEGRQTMLFSATLPAWVRRLATTYLRSPTTVDLVGEEGAGRVADGVTVLAAPVPPGEKRSLLPDLISVYAPRGKAVVFCQTKREADEVAAAVAGTHPSEALHGDISQSGREKALGAFRSGQARVLVATDVAARGLDIPHVDLVVHYDLPGDQETFLHRSGRTGRAGNKGTGERVGVMQTLHAWATAAVGAMGGGQRHGLGAASVPLPQRPIPLSPRSHRHVHPPRAWRRGPPDARDGHALRDRGGARPRARGGSHGRGSEAAAVGRPRGGGGAVPGGSGGGGARDGRRGGDEPRTGVHVRSAGAAPGAVTAGHAAGPRDAAAGGARGGAVRGRRGGVAAPAWPQLGRGRAGPRAPGQR